MASVEVFLLIFYFIADCFLQQIDGGDREFAKAGFGYPLAISVGAFRCWANQEHLHRDIPVQKVTLDF